MSMSGVISFYNHHKLIVINVVYYNTEGFLLIVYVNLKIMHLIAILCRQDNVS